MITPKLTIDVGGCFGLSPDGTRVAVAKKAVGRKMAKIVSLADGAVLTEFDRLPENTRAIVFSPDGDTIVFGAMYNKVTFADPMSGSIRITARIDDSGELEDLAYAPDGMSIFRSTSDGVRIINAQTGSISGPLCMTTPPSTLRTMYGEFAFSGNGTKLALSADACISIIDWPTTTSETIVWSSTQSVFSSWADSYNHQPCRIAFTSDDNQLLVADRAARFWIVDLCYPVGGNTSLWLDRSKTRPGRTDADPCFSSFDFSPDRRLLVIGVRGTLELWDWLNRKLIRSIELPGKEPTAMQVAFTSTGDRIVVALGRSTVVYWVDQLI